MAYPALFRTLQPWLVETFGHEVHRVALDAGSNCPNRDGTKGRGGCVYCDVEGSGTGAFKRGEELAMQLADGLARIARRGVGVKAIAYFQSYSNTYVPTDRLDEVLRVTLPHLGKEIVALSIATRPDTLSDDALALLGEWNARVPVWVELGLEVGDDAQLVAINRLHTVADFEDAVRRAKTHGLLTVGHAILGLPGDGRAGARRTADVLARSHVEGIKVHHLMILRRTILEHWWREGRVEPLTAETYVDWLADFVERLASDQVLHRITADAPDEQLLAPRWSTHKNAIRERLEHELARRGSRQGARTAE